MDPNCLEGLKISKQKECHVTCQRVPQITPQRCDELSHQIVLIKVFIVFPTISMIVIIVTKTLWNVTLTLLEEEVLAKIHMCFH